MVNRKHLVWGIALWAALFYTACSLDGSMEELRERAIKERMDHPVKVPGDTLDAKLTWLQNNAKDYTAYLLELSAGESMGPRTFISGKRDISGYGMRITITGGSSECVISLAPDAKDSLLTVARNFTLILGHNITLRGHGNNNAPLVSVNGSLEMVDNAKITGNTNTSTKNGGGVYVSSIGSFTMSGSASVSNNTVIATQSFSSDDNGTASYSYRANGGGVYVDCWTSSDSSDTSKKSGTFIMSGSSSVSNNTVIAAATDSRSTSFANGGGVYSSGTFTMSESASVSNNKASSSSYYYTPASYGGGVYSSGTFTMSGSASVSNNTLTAATEDGGTGYTRGGGVHIGSTLIKLDSDVYTYTYGTFTMRDNVVVSGNTAGYHHSEGGGVYASGYVKIEGGIIYGADAAEGLRNTAGNSSAALYASSAGQYGISNGTTFNINGDLTTTDSTIHIVNGVKQP